MGRRKALEFLDKLRGIGFARPNPYPMFPNPPGLLRLEPHSEGLRERIWWGAASNATAVWAAENGMYLQSSTLKYDESGKPFHIQQAEQIRLYKEAWKKAGHRREPRVSVSRSVFALVTDQDRYYFGQEAERSDKKLCCRTGSAHKGTGRRRSHPGSGHTPFNHTQHIRR
jgi:alkanesulfonate monooxygenase SsuD/methylene tetrahydromethanopterin reductase-like flavin-dependent oxidoreductase (luciferase family)